ncbi:hypothetical protein TELCIR_08948 [Teladorsagia circumcincta]|uniref:Uncharacterized protein n=1 Tax=Teladorsagia circumcincta TaxID=45464 RepID=A0A2G9UG66_TELCI|nr:hypothetical protein TELCIR_08948 [Teladorsagia circumcincta]
MLGELINNDDQSARMRIEELERRCMKCQIVDIKPSLVDEANQYWGYNATTNLLYIDQWNNFTRFGKERIRQVFEELAKNFALS